LPPPPLGACPEPEPPIHWRVTPLPPEPGAGAERGADRGTLGADRGTLKEPPGPPPKGAREP
jgi:hypothetical protein